MKKVIVDGNEACSLSAYLFTEAAGIYPITPSSPMAEHMDEWSNQDKKNIWNDNVEKHKQNIEVLTQKAEAIEKELADLLSSL